MAAEDIKSHVINDELQNDIKQEPSYCDRILLISQKTNFKDYTENKFKTITNISSHSDHFGVEYKKYLKYKNKYLYLKYNGNV